jgi:hypothetical protein
MSTPLSVQIIGLVRFSFVATGDFYPAFKTPESLAEFLFDQGRLRRRFKLFEKICLPNLARQTDQNFTCIFLTSRDLPIEWRERLDALLVPFPWARVVALPPGNHYPSIRQAFDTVPPDGSTHRLTFRLDDDDAFDLTHIARLRDLALRLLPVLGVEIPLALGFNRGLYAELKKGDNDIYDAGERVPLSVGAALVTPIASRENVYRQNHRALAEFYNTFSEATSHVFLRTTHRDNKSDPHFSGHQRALKDEEIDRILSENFGIDPVKLRGM